MFQSRSLDKKYLRIINNNKQSWFSELLTKDGSFSVYEGNFQN